jgi:hypothetical protein
MSKLAIFRVPDVEGEKCFAQVTVDDDGEFGDLAPMFTVGPDSSYQLMNFSHIVIADPIEGGSRDLMRYEIGGDGEEAPIIHELDAEVLQTIILHLIEVTAEDDDNIYLDDSPPLH